MPLVEWESRQQTNLSIWRRVVVENGEPEKKIKIKWLTFWLRFVSGVWIIDLPFYEVWGRLPFYGVWDCFVKTNKQKKKPIVDVVEVTCSEEQRVKTKDKHSSIETESSTSILIILVTKVFRRFSCIS